MTMLILSPAKQLSDAHVNGQQASTETGVNVRGLDLIFMNFFTAQASHA